LRIERARAARVVFPPEEVAQVKAIACELPSQQGLLLSRFSRAELHRFVVERAVSEASASTIGRWLAEDAIKPWQQRSWIFPRDPDFLEKAGRVLDLYQGRWEGRLLEPSDMVICADAKPSIQARARIHQSAPPAPGRGQLVEHEYERMGALCYLAAWDARRAKIFDRCAPKDGIEFAIIAKGRLGGQELGYGSDADVLFVFGTRSESAEPAERTLCQERGPGPIGRPLTSTSSTALASPSTLMSSRAPNRCWWAGAPSPGATCVECGLAPSWAAVNRMPVSLISNWMLPSW